MKKKERKDEMGDVCWVTRDGQVQQTETDRWKKTGNYSIESSSSHRLSGRDVSGKVKERD